MADTIYGFQHYIYALDIGLVKLSVPFQLP